MSDRIGNTADFSLCRQYRYSLWRDLNVLQPAKSGYVLFIGLNPSTADETANDPTIRRCMRFAESWGYGMLCMANLFAFRATEPHAMKAAALPVGSLNDQYLLRLSNNAALVVAAWGANGGFMHRDATVKNMIANLHYLRLTKNGYPEHPLYLPASLTPKIWMGSDGN